MVCGEAAAGFAEVVVALGEAEAGEIFAAALGEEGAAGDGGDSGLAEEMAGFVAGGGSGKGGDVGEDVVGAGRDGGGHSGLGESGAEHVALDLVVGGEGLIEAGRKLEKSGGGGVLEGGRAADVGEVVEVADGSHPASAGGEIADPPSGDAEGFGEAGDGDGALGHSWEGSGADVAEAVVEEVLVDLVGDDEEVVLDGKGGDGFEFLAGEDFAAGIGRGINDEAAGAGRDGGAEAGNVERPVRRFERDGDGLDAESAQGVEVIAVKRLEEDDLVAGIEEGEAGGVEGSGGSGGDEDFALGIGGDAVVVGELGGDGLAERSDAVEAGIDVVAFGHGGSGAVEDRRGDFSVADALGEVDAAEAVAFDGHGANFRLDEAGRDGAEAELFGCDGHWNHLYDKCMSLGAGPAREVADGCQRIAVKPARKQRLATGTIWRNTA